MPVEMLSISDFIQINELMHRDRFRSQPFVSYLGQGLKTFLGSLLEELGVHSTPVVHGTTSPQAIIEGPVYIAEGAVIEPTAYVQGPCYIGPGSEVRHGAYIRGNVYVGRDCVVGHATESKGSVFLDGAKAGHFAYVGDSILGRNSNLGAGTKLANLRLLNDEVKIVHPETRKQLGTGLRKFGACLGDNAQTGCNAVLNPGTLLFPGTGVLACVSYTGTLTSGWATK